MIVLDASALVDIVTDRPGGLWLADRLVGHELIAPGHQAVEVLSALARLSRAGLVSDDEIEGALDEALGLQQTVIPLSAGLVRRVFSMRGRVRVADGFYVALAQERGCPLLTSDRRLARAGLPVEVLTPPDEAD